MARLRDYRDIVAMPDQRLADATNQCFPVWASRALTAPRGNGKMPPREEPPVDRYGSRLSRWAFMLGAGWRAHRRHAGRQTSLGCGPSPRA
jgi:hypothetical protein